jgi:hypothetical protein
VLSLSAGELFLELIALVIATVPTGLLLVRLGERVAGRRVGISPPERLLLALYATGAIAYLLAAVPLPVYGTDSVALLLVAGSIGYLIVCIRERGAGLRAFLNFARTRTAVALGALTVGVLAVEIAGIANLTLANMLDGSVYSLFVNLLLTHHSVPWTLSPFANVGVIYPQTAPVWMSLPTLMFGWPIVTAPLALPPLFLALSVVGAYCVGDRFAQRAAAESRTLLGLLFAGFFGIVVSWPRFFVGGSFDFVFCLPLFLVIFAWLVPFVSGPSRSLRETAVFGVVVGIASGLSAMIGLTILLLLAGFLAAYLTFNLRTAISWTYRWLVVAGIAALALLRSLVAVAVWFNYPGHVLTPVGNPPPATPFVTQTLSYRYLNGELNPFVWLKPKLSPFPVLSLEIAILLAAGIILGALAVLRPSGRWARYLPTGVVRPVFVGTGVLLAETAVLAVGGAVNTTISGLQSLVNIEEVSILLFTFYELIAVLPLVAGLLFLREFARRPVQTMAPPTAAKLGPLESRPRDRARTRIALGVTAFLVLALPLASGAVLTADQAPGFIEAHIDQLAHVTSADISALEWSGSNLPACSKVLVAPGSVGQYLPEFAKVGIVFPAFPTPVNLSYQLIVQSLDAGTYGNQTRALMVGLGVTTVFISGQNSVSYLPFLLPPLESSSDFEMLYAAGDASILEFVPGAVSSGCLP